MVLYLQASGLSSSKPQKHLLLGIDAPTQYIWDRLTYQAEGMLEYPRFQQ